MVDRWHGHACGFGAAYVHARYGREATPSSVARLQLHIAAQRFRATHSEGHIMRQEAEEEGRGGDWGIPISATAYFGHPSPSKRWK